MLPKIHLGEAHCIYSQNSIFGEAQCVWTKIQSPGEVLTNHLMCDQTHPAKHISDSIRQSSR